MLDINLLPWREYKKIKNKKKLKIISIATIAFLFAIFLLIHFIFVIYNNTLSEKVETLSRHLENKAVVLTPVNQTSIISLEEMKHIKDEQKFMRTIYQHLLHNQQVVQFNEISLEKNDITFRGTARSAQDLTYFLTHWSIANLFSKIELDYLKKQENHTGIFFKFRATRLN